MRDPSSTPEIEVPDNLSGVAKRPVTVENPFSDPEFVAALQEDLEAEKRGEIDEGLTREAFEARYAEYLPER